jgi:hypothetical protein
MPFSVQSFRFRARFRVKAVSLVVGKERPFL